MTKYLYRISQDQYTGYDTYDSAVVVATSKAEAQLMHPSHDTGDDSGVGWGWCAPEHVKVRCIGIALPGEHGVLCASFNAG